MEMQVTIPGEAVEQATFELVEQPWQTALSSQEEEEEEAGDHLLYVAARRIVTTVLQGAVLMGKVDKEAHKQPVELEVLHGQALLREDPLEPWAMVVKQDFGKPLREAVEVEDITVVVAVETMDVVQEPMAEVAVVLDLL
jgi:hypothetical protein